MLSSLKSFLNNRVIYLFYLLVSLAGFRVALSLITKATFIGFQVLALWLTISWLSGTVLPSVKELLEFDDASIVYPVISGVLLFLASLASFVSRLIALQSINKLEDYIFGAINREDVLVSDYRNITKLLLALMDALIPLTLIIVVLIAWLVKLPELMPLLTLLVVLISLLLRVGARFSRTRFKYPVKRAKNIEYIGSDEHQKFYRILMLPQYLSLATYGLISVAMVGIVISTQYMSVGGNVGLGLLPIATALALLQFKSFVGLLVRLGVYSGSAYRVANLIRSQSPNREQK